MGEFYTTDSFTRGLFLGAMLGLMVGTLGSDTGMGRLLARIRWQLVKRGLCYVGLIVLWVLAVAGSLVIGAVMGALFAAVEVNVEVGKLWPRTPVVR